MYIVLDHIPIKIGDSWNVGRTLPFKTLAVSLRPSLCRIAHMAPGFTEVINKLYYSNVDDVNQEIVLDVPNSISNVICLGTVPKAMKKRKKSISLLVYNTKKNPVGDKEWIYHFPDILCLLTEGVAQGGAWIIAPQRSKALFIIISYIIWKDKMPLTESMRQIPELTESPLTPVQFYQLQLWSRMGGNIEPSYKPYIRYKTQVMPEKVRRFSVIRDERNCATLPAVAIENALKDYQDQSIEDSLFSFPNDCTSIGYTCCACSTLLFSSTYIFSHNIDTDYAPVLHSEYPCSAVTVEPLRWMDNITYSEKGDITCFGCATIIGNYDWNAKKCPDCAHDVPAFFGIDINKIKFEKNIETRRKRDSGRKEKLFRFWEKKPKDLESHPTLRLVIIATCYDELPAKFQKELQHSNISPQLVDQRWDISKSILSFCLRAKILSQEKDEAENIKSHSHENKIHVCESFIRGIERITAGTGFRNGRADDFFEIEMEKEKEAEAEVLPLEHPVVQEYLQYVETEWKPCTLPHLDISVPNYIELVSMEVLSLDSAKSIFKEKLQKIGKGGYGEVFVCTEKISGKKYAVKKLDHFASDPVRRAKNLREVMILQSCTHENIVKYYGCYEVDEQLWVVMEHLEGGSLAEIHSMMPIDEHQMAYIAQECLFGLHYLHSLGLGHRDLKPGNIMFTKDCSVKLIDFGICETAQGMATKANMVGSAFWMPPEMIFHAPHTLKSDVWSLGCTLLQIGDPALFDLGSNLTTMFTVADNGRDILGRPSSLSSSALGFLSSMLQKDPRSRLSVSELLQHPFIMNAPNKDCMDNIRSNWGIAQAFR